MNHSTLSATPAIDRAQSLADEELLSGYNEPDLISDDDIDYAAIAAATQPDQPGGRIVFDSADYETDEEAMVALEALLMKALEEPDDEVTAQT